MFVLHYKGIDVVCLVGLQYHCELRNRFALDTHHLGRVFLMILMVSVMECPRLFPRPRPGKADSKASTVSASCEGGLSPDSSSGLSLGVVLWGRVGGTEEEYSRGGLGSVDRQADVLEFAKFA